MPFVQGRMGLPGMEDPKTDRHPTQTMTPIQLIQATAPTLHAKYSPNLHMWMMRQKPHRNGTPTVYRDAETQHLSIGWIHPGECFSGTEMDRVLTRGVRAQMWYYSRRMTDNLQPIPDFWEQYIALGRCAMDPKHRQSFIGDSTRWETTGDTRGCVWCGKATQRLRRWTETVEHQAWESVKPAPGSAMPPPFDRCSPQTCVFVDLKPPGTGSRCTTCGFECPF